jgi:hypothetical protein
MTRGHLRSISINHSSRVAAMKSHRITMLRVIPAAGEIKYCRPRGTVATEVTMRLSRALLRSPTLLMMIGLVSGSVGLVAGALPARADACFDLWVERNSIYKAYGYCFKTAKAINYFGNAGCTYDNEGDIPMSNADRNQVLSIKKREQQLGCL